MTIKEVKESKEVSQAKLAESLVIGRTAITMRSYAYKGYP